VPSVLVVDDSSFMRLALRQIIEAEGDLRVVGEANDGLAAIEAATRLRPDLVVMDLAMPRMDGLEATRHIMRLPCPPAVVMVSAHTRDGSADALAALDHGAVDYLWKDSDLGGADLARLDRELRPLLRRWAAERGPAPAPLPPPPSWPLAPFAPPQVLVVGASTGGPDAVGAFLQACGKLPIPCVVAQHMPAGLAPSLAEALGRRLERRVTVATDGMALPPGLVALLPGGQDGALVRRTASLALRLLQTGTTMHPSIDALFHSAAAVAPGAVGVVLSGMGRDGAAGAAAMAARQMPILAQAPASCVVAGMPGAVIAAGLAQAVGTPAELGARVAAMLSSMPR
jgi:two-component system chemotaxis response regulator CheB